MIVPEAIARLAAARRILVLGSPGSGKTSLTVQLSQILKLEAMHLDAHFWQPGWVPTPQPQWRQTVRSLIARPEWIMDGTYENSLDLRIPPSEAIVVLDAWRWRCLWRVVRRRLETGQRPRIDAPSGQTIDIAFLRYIWNYPTITRPYVSREIQRLGATKTLVELKSGADIPRFLQRLRQAADRGRLDS